MFDRDMIQGEGKFYCRNGEVIEGTQVHHIDELRAYAEANEVKLGVVAVPSAAAQEVADILVKVQAQ